MALQTVSKYLTFTVYVSVILSNFEPTNLPLSAEDDDPNLLAGAGRAAASYADVLV